MKYGSQILDLHTAYEQKAKAAVISPGDGQQLLLHSAILHNRSGASANLGVLVRLADYKFGTLPSGAAVVDATAAIAAGTTQNIFTTTNNDGFLLQSKKKFNLIGLEITQASTGSPAYTYQYYNGTAWTALPDVIEVPSYSGTGSSLLVFTAPRDWAVGTPAADGGDSDKYAIRVRATTAPGQAVQANALWVGKFIHFQEAVADNGNLSVTFPYEQPKLLDGGEGILPYFGTASASNCVSALYQSK